MVKRWYKKDIKWLKQQIDTFKMQSDLYYTPDSIAVAIDVNKVNIIISGAENFRDMLVERMNGDRETARHARTSGVHGTATDEVVERFKKLADGCEKDIARITYLYGAY